MIGYGYTLARGELGPAQGLRAQFYSRVYRDRSGVILAVLGPGPPGSSPGDPLKPAVVRGGRPVGFDFAKEFWCVGPNPKRSPSGGNHGETAF